MISLFRHDETPGRQPAGRKSCQKSIDGAAGVLASVFLGLSATSASVVINSEATEAASCNAVRTTLAGSITLAFTRIEGGVVSEVINLESSGVGASDRRPRHDQQYHEDAFPAG